MQSIIRSIAIVCISLPFIAGCLGGSSSGLTISDVSVQEVTGSSVKIRWLTNEPGTSQVWYGPNIDCEQSTVPYPDLTMEHEISINGLEDNTVYYFRVLSLDRFGSEATYPVQGFMTLDKSPPSEALEFSVVSDNGQNHLAWTTPSDLDLYGQLLTFSNTGFPATIDEGTILANDMSAPGVTCWLLHSKLTNDLPYYYTLFTYDEHGNYSIGVQAMGIPAETDPPKIYDVTIVPTSLDAVVVWYTNIHTTSQVEYGLDTSYGSLNNVHGAYGGYHKMVISGLEEETLYHLRVRSVDRNGLTLISEDHVFYTHDADSDSTPPGSPIGFTVMARDRDNVLQWTTPMDEDIQGAVIRRSYLDYPTTPAEGDGGYIFLCGPNKFMSVVAGAVPDKTHYYSLWVYDEVPNFSVMATGSGTPVMAPPIISSVSAAPTSTTAIIQWDTDERADSKVLWFPCDQPAAANSTFNSYRTENHSMTITDLIPEADYCYEVTSADIHKNISTSDGHTFSTLPQ